MADPTTPTKFSPFFFFLFLHFSLPKQPFFLFTSPPPTEPPSSSPTIEQGKKKKFKWMMKPNPFSPWNFDLSKPIQVGGGGGSEGRWVDRWVVKHTQTNKILIPSFPPSLPLLPSLFPPADFGLLVYDNGDRFTFFHDIIFFFIFISLFLYFFLF